MSTLKDLLSQLENKNEKTASAEKVEEKVAPKIEPKAEKAPEIDKTAEFQKLAEDLYSAGALLADGFVDALIKKAAGGTGSGAMTNPVNISSAPNPANDPSTVLAKLKEIENMFSFGAKFKGQGQSDPGTTFPIKDSPQGPKVWERGADNYKEK